MKKNKFDDDFDAGKDITSYLDLKNARRPMREQKRINVDFPTWMVVAIDKEACRLGVTRQSLIKVWMSDRLSNGTNPQA